jgi:hypothetical protein
MAPNPRIKKPRNLEENSESLAIDLNGRSSKSDPTSGESKCD